MRTRPMGTAGSCGACTSAPQKTGGTPETLLSPSGWWDTILAAIESQRTKELREGREEKCLGVQQHV